MSGVLPLLLTAALALLGVLLPAGTWHAGVSGPTAIASTSPTGDDDATQGPGLAYERSIVGRGLDRHVAMPGLTPEERGATVAQDSHRVTTVATGQADSADPGSMWARAPPGARGDSPAV